MAVIGGAQRPGQVQMAEAVAHAFDTGEHLAVQAGTGTGKSLAYLVPAIARAVADDTPVVISTATIALQRQLVDRDLPRLVDALADTLPAWLDSRCSKGRAKLPVPEQDPLDPRRETRRRRPGRTVLRRGDQRAGPRRGAADRMGVGHDTGDRDELRPGVSGPGLVAGQRLSTGMPRAGPLPLRRRLFLREGAREAGRRTSSSPTTPCWPSTPSPRPRCCPSTTPGDRRGRTS